MARWPAVRARLALLLVPAALVGCAPPSHSFVASSDDDLVFKMPRSWATVRDGPSADSTTGQADGGWIGVFDGARDPDVKHLELASNAVAPVALARVFVVSAQQASDLDGDKLRDFYLPFTATARAQYATDPRIKSFHRLGDWNVHSSTGTGVHVIYSYDLGSGPQVFDQIVMVGSRRTRVYVLVVRCNQSCYDAKHSEIEEAVSSFSVKLT